MEDEDDTLERPVSRMDRAMNAATREAAKEPIPGESIEGFDRRIKSAFRAAWDAKD